MTAASAFPGGALPVASGSRTWQVVRALSRGHRLRLAAVTALGLVSTATDLIIPVAIGYLIDRVQTGNADLGLVAAVAVTMAVSAIVGAAGTAATIVLAARGYHTMLAELRERLVGQAMSLPQHVVERAGTGDLISRSSDDVNEVAGAAPAVIPAFTVTLFTIVVTVAGMAVLDWPYAVAFLIVLPVYALTLRWYLRTGPNVYRAERAAMSIRAQHILESQRGYATVLGFGLAEHRHRTVLEASWGVAAHTLRTRTVQNMFFGRLGLTEYLGLAATLVTGFLLIDAGQSTIGAATTAMLLMLRLLGPVNQLLFVVDILQSALTSLTRMVGVITMPAAEPAASSARTARKPGTSPAGRKAVRLEGVRFSYDGNRPALDDLHLTIPAGERVAVVGASGAGKTTLAAVIAGIHTPQTGTVLRPTRTAVITQEAHVFAGTLRDNLTLAAPATTDTHVRAALKRTGVAGLLDLLPDGLDTRLGTAGHLITAAQAQQIALARVVLADPDLAILDEATAEAGSTHAQLLDHAADAALTGRTGIVIAHRLSQAAACDRILVMADGKIIEDGTHTELLTTGGTYARLWTARSHEDNCT